MKKFSTGEYKSALNKKGFRLERSTKDDVFYLYVNDARTSIHTKISHGASEDIGNPLMKMIKTQLCLDSKEIEQFIDCPMKHEDYVNALKERGINI